MNLCLSSSMSPGTLQAVPTADLTPAIERIRQDFPILSQRVHGKPLVFLDSAASAQRPQTVLDAMDDCYTRYYANIHRGVYAFSEQSTAAYEKAREQIRAFLNAKSGREIVFTKNITEAINLVAASYGRAHLEPGDEILISLMEHHSNIVPWQLVCEQTGATLKAVPIDDDGELILEAYETLLSERTRLVAMTHVSNALGTILPVEKIIEMAHAKGIPVLLDGAQAVPHMPVDVQALDCDFYGFTGHKAFGPSGIGVLYGKAEYLETMPPYQGGGDMIRTVRIDKSEYADLPQKFEAGTPNIAGAIGMGAAIDWIQSIGYELIQAQEQDLLEYATAQFRQVPGATILGNARHKASVMSFILDGVHPHDIGTVLDQEGIAVRTGHHCAQPVMERFDVAATARASFAVYNTRAEVDALVAAV